MEVTADVDDEEDMLDVPGVVSDLAVAILDYSEPADSF